MRIIETSRLVLREMTTNDFDALFAVLSDSKIMCYYPYKFDKQRVEKWILTNFERYSIFGFGLWAVELKANKQVIGDCGITMQNINGLIKPEIGYHIHRDFQQRGFAKEAVCACIDWAKQNTPFRKLYSYMKTANLPSQATARSVGMQLIEEFTDSENERTSVFVINI